MAIQQLFDGDPTRNATLYLAIGVISLVKAIAVRNDQRRFRRELLDAGLFLGLGLLLRQLGQRETESATDVRDRLPEWADEALTIGRQLRRESKPEPEPETVQERMKKLVVG